MKVKFKKGETLSNGTIKEHMALDLFNKKWFKNGKNFGDLVMKKSVVVTIKLK